MLVCFVKKAIIFALSAVPFLALFNGCATDTGGPLGGGNYTNAGGNASGGQTQNGGSGNVVSAGGNTGTGGSTSFGTPGGGFMVTDTWHGWAWTSVGGGATITPATFPSAKAGDPLCVQGTVPHTTAYSGLAMLGVNLNQKQAANSPALTVTPTKAGIIVSVTNTGASPLRLQIQGPSGATDPTDRWCAPIAGDGGFIPYTAFNTTCWDNKGAYYNGQPLTAAMIMVPGGGPTDPDINFNFCLNSIAEGDDPNSSSGGGGCDITGPVGSGSGTTSGPFGLINVTRDGHNYIIQNNAWGDQSTGESLSVNGVSFTVNGQNRTRGTSGGPVSYPDIFTGNNNNHATTGNNMPKQISALTKVQTGWSINAGPSIAGTYNAAYDVWFNTSNSTGSNSPTGAYLMVWFYKPGNAQPIGKLASSSVSITGTNWDVWYDPSALQNGVHVISYVHSGNITDLSFDLNAFIKDAVQRGVLQSSWYLTNIFAGFEIWDGGNGLKTNNFCAVVN